MKIFIGGTGRCGTSQLSRILGEHPQGIGVPAGDARLVRRVRRWRRGALPRRPTQRGRQPAWPEFLRQEKADGKRRYRVHVLTRPLTPYVRYECEWGYVPNVAAGEEIRILDLTDTPRPDGLVDDEFWILDDELVLIMKYDDEGRFLGAVQSDEIGPYLRARDVAMAASVEFAGWWEQHPEEWRVNWLGH